MTHTLSTSHSNSSLRTARLSLLPEELTHADHQMAGEYRHESNGDVIKITFRHLLLRSGNEDKKWPLTLLNPFVIKCRSEEGIFFAIRDAPESLYWFHLVTSGDEHHFGPSTTRTDSVVKMQRMGTIVDRKCNFSYHSIRNAFEHLRATNGLFQVCFSSEGWSRRKQNTSLFNAISPSIEVLNPLACRVCCVNTTYWYFIDLSSFHLMELVQEHNCLELNAYTIFYLPDSYWILLKASPFFASTRDTDHTDRFPQIDHIDANTETV